MGQGEVFQEARQALIGRGEAEATGRLRQGASQPSLANPGGTDDEAVEVFAQPLAGGQVLDQCPCPGPVASVGPGLPDRRTGADALGVSGSGDAGARVR